MNNLIDFVTSELRERPNIDMLIERFGIELNDNAWLHPQIVGQIERLNDIHFRISAQGSDHEYRRRFTKAHELGHWIWHRTLIGTGVDDNKAYRSTDVGEFHNTRIGPAEERQANSFAAKLLMPEQLVREHHKLSFERNAPNTAFQNLYHFFKVSPAALRWRLRNLQLRTDEL